MAGQVLVDDEPVDKAGTRVGPEATVRLRGDTSRYVSRGGDKLAGALEDLSLDPTGLQCLDLGASTGGFSDCLLQHGATGVVAVDVGYGQLHEKLRQDPRVRALERTNARHLDPAEIREPIDLVVMDVSFISSRIVLTAAAGLAPGAPVLVMVKPQFELGPEKVGKGGVVKDDALRREAVELVAAHAQELGYRIAGEADSRVPGPKGNREIFLLLEREETDTPG